MIKENQNLLNKFNAISDIIILFISITLAYLIRFYIFSPDTYYITLTTYIEFSVIIIPINLILFNFFNLYHSFRTRSFVKECSAIIKSNTILTAVLLSLLFVLKLVHISRLVIIIFYFVNIMLIMAKRLILRKILSRMRTKGLNLKHVVIVGAGEVANEYLDVLKNNKSFGYNYSGYVSDASNFQGRKLGNYSDLYNVLNEYKPDEVVCALDLSDAKYLENIVSDCEKSGTKISIIPFCYKYIPSQPYIDQLGSIPLINIRRIPLDNLGNAFIKRSLDILGSLFLILCTSPIMIITAVIIKFTSNGPIIFKQKRVGLNKNLFVMYKFRSMKINSQEETGWSTDNDPRKTKFGSFIRKFSIDELPQFFNVLKGDMSLVGPRPELPHFVENFKNEIPLYMVKHQVKPGITGLAQVNGYRGDTSIKKRIEFDIHYIENWNILMDMSILFKTAFKGFKNNEKIRINSTKSTNNEVNL
ncbi:MULTISPECIES: undecaprenyl-phosphate glucose phosphotransferase [Clostridium]|jgi:Undecaprenyl-phosphate glucose phosphotransferase|uniref:Undecaprenyl-phosphate glucose phosphotransferase n=2 Tax=Clostridium beijerinckii TaxID=1520 RepID=A0AAE2RPZ8_CLOBE|nr:undecaprenyl-phosphate glucose phosphotransferase [Clostridium beijerinckii]ABR36864.1 Undecaprenyl-phosphate galactose phosphotransferase [Clostridium beijerinckii NCIMB 8052]AIU03897.1 undecaprenyl-phosphate galactose phosphotransferase [Clostridium beijerinckii ATCC 35702]MBF7808489.1 undecaprenyl-phosphate glucose phosphotransferase [Clostridium beijerinckii]OOM42686.1 UDP-glucose:undecaprenyl-phosphate glucose-1-phosphate transferase [Clostridium beijerinckii]OOM52239.1 UDP-glucose:und